MSPVKHIHSRALVGVLLALCCSAVAAERAPNTSWKGVRHECIGYGKGKVSAKLEGIPFGWSWEEQCEQYPPPFNQHGASGPPVCKKDALATGIWGEWTIENDSKCLPYWDTHKEAGCVGPNKQVYSAKLLNIRDKDWKEACEAMPGEAGRGLPDRCVVTATGVWGEWYDANQACTKPLEWGSFKDNGCVKDMKPADANIGGVYITSKRSYSAVLYNAGGDWTDACRQAPADVKTKDGFLVEFRHPTACTIADADRPLSYGVGAVLGGLSGAATMPAGGAGVAVGAAVAIASTAVTEAVVAGIDTGLNVWGIFWVDDTNCGTIPEYESLDDSGKVLLNTGEVTSRLRGSGTAAGAGSVPAATTGQRE